MVEYVFEDFTGAFRLCTDCECFYEEEPELEEIYDEGLDGILVYLEERDDARAKSLIKAYFTDSINKLKKAEVEVED